uniref:Uncharacterized protein n=1 Tax=Anguilla anguilla TaxID=7936 RepID=A0A0E9UXK9_ANGAN
MNLKNRSESYAACDTAAKGKTERFGLGASFVQIIWRRMLLYMFPRYFLKVLGYCIAILCLKCASLFFC